MILSKQPDIERFLADPGKGVRAAVIYGRDRGVVRERANQLAKKAPANPDDPFGAQPSLTESDIDGDPARLDGEARRHLDDGRPPAAVRLRLHSKAGPRQGRFGQGA